MFRACLRSLIRRALNTQVEASKKTFKGSELKGRTLGVLGLGAIGSMVADIALATRYERFWVSTRHCRLIRHGGLSSRVQKMDSIEALFARSDLVTLHVPALPETEKMVNATLLAAMKPGSVLLNFARGEIVDTAAIKASLTNGQLGQYISDFPVPELVNHAGCSGNASFGCQHR